MITVDAIFRYIWMYFFSFFIYALQVISRASRTYFSSSLVLHEIVYYILLYHVRCRIVIYPSYIFFFPNRQFWKSIIYNKSTFYIVKKIIITTRTHRYFNTLRFSIHSVATSGPINGLRITLRTPLKTTMGNS